MMIVIENSRLSFNRRQTIREHDTQTRYFAPVTLTLTWWPWYTNFTEVYLHIKTEFLRSKLTKVGSLWRATQNISTLHSPVINT